MHAPPLFRDTRNPADDIPPSQLADLVPETDWFASLPDWALPDPPLDLSRFVVTVSLPAIATSDAALRALAERHPAEFAHARAAVAAKHGIQCLDVAYRLPTDALDLVDVLVELRASGLEAWAKSSPEDATLIRVYTRDNVLSMIDADVLARAREAADDMLAEQAMPDVEDAA